MRHWSSLWSLLSSLTGELPVVSYALLERALAEERIAAADVVAQRRGSALVSRRVLDYGTIGSPIPFSAGRGLEVLSQVRGQPLKSQKSNFFHAIYRIQEQLGKAFYQLEPYALYPPRDYFVLRLPGRMEPCHPPVSAAPGARMTRGEKPAATRSWQRVPA